MADTTSSKASIILDNLKTSSTTPRPVSTSDTIQVYKSQESQSFDVYKVFQDETLIFIVGIPSLICIILVCCGLYTLLKKRNPPQPPYSAAVQNRDFFEDKENLRCLNCHLIEMGSMACYQGICPQCGRPPPGYS